MPRIDINVSAEDSVDGDLVSNLISTTLTTHGFTDVANVGSVNNYQTDPEVLTAMRNLSPSIFDSEITVGISEYEPPESADGIEEGLPGNEEFADPEVDE